VNIDELAQRAGWGSWMEHQLFVVLGGWTKTLAIPQAKAMVGSHSSQHAWHAQLWRDRIPAINGSDGAHFIVGTDVDVRAIALLHKDSATDIQRLAAMYHVVMPSVLDGYRRHLGAIDPMVDGSTARVLQLIVADEVAAVCAGQQLVQSFMTTTDDEVATADYVAKMTSAMESLLH
jgi:hypothetical protein